jgi:endonuclease YncB( thermonuclease family)
MQSTAAMLARLVLDRQVEIEVFQQDRYERLVAAVSVNGENVNVRLVESGAAWAYRRYMRKADASLCEDENAARLAKRGIWALPMDDRIAPWEYRSRKNRDSIRDYDHETTVDCVAAIRRRY